MSKALWGCTQAQRCFEFTSNVNMLTICLVSVRNRAITNVLHQPGPPFKSFITFVIISSLTQFAKTLNRLHRWRSCVCVSVCRVTVKVCLGLLLQQRKVEPAPVCAWWWRAEQLNHFNAIKHPYFLPSLLSVWVLEYLEICLNNRAAGGGLRFPESNMRSEPKAKLRMWIYYYIT